MRAGGIADKVALDLVTDRRRKVTFRCGPVASGSSNLGMRGWGLWLLVGRRRWGASFEGRGREDDG